MTDTVEDLQNIADTAMREALKILDAAQARISSTDIAPAAHGETVAAELGRVGFPASLMRLALWRRNRTDRWKDLVDVAAELNGWIECAKDAEQRRDDMIRAALADGESASKLADAVGFKTPKRIYQIRDYSR